jgi:ubiquinone/menaquinone biosynthesis C-methylase UbiE
MDNRERQMSTSELIPALRFHALTRFFDPVVRVTTRERTFKKHLVKQVALRPGHRVVDIGCGTATLAIELKRMCPQAEVHGVDGDEQVLELARRKVDDARVDVELHRALAWELPFADGSIDRVVSSLMFHHLHRDAKHDALLACHRALKSGGELHIADWGRAHGIAMRAAFLGVQLLDGFATTHDHVAGRLPRFIAEAGFSDVTETRRLRTPLGTLSLYRARR